MHLSADGGLSCDKQPAERAADLAGCVSASQAIQAAGRQKHDEFDLSTQQSTKLQYMYQVCDHATRHV